MHRHFNIRQIKFAIEIVKAKYTVTKSIQVWRPLNINVLPEFIVACFGEKLRLRRISFIKKFSR